MTTRSKSFHIKKKETAYAQSELALYLDEDSSIENAAVQRLQSRIKHTKIENANHESSNTWKGQEDNRINQSN